MKAMASRYDPDAHDYNVEAIIERHHRFQKHLQSLPICKVGIPYAESLARKMPATDPKCRRAMQQVFSIIEAIVVIMQDRREVRNGFRIATLEDYDVARSLMLRPLHTALGAGERFKDAKRLREALTKPLFTTPEVKAAMEFNNDMTTSKFLNGLLTAGLLQRVSEGKKGKPAMYQWTDTGNAKMAMTILPTVGTVRKEMPKFLNPR